MTDKAPGHRITPAVGRFKFHIRFVLRLLPFIEFLSQQDDIQSIKDTADRSSQNDVDIELRYDTKQERRGQSSDPFGLRNQHRLSSGAVPAIEHDHKQDRHGRVLRKSRVGRSHYGADDYRKESHFVR